MKKLLIILLIVIAAVAAVYFGSAAVFGIGAANGAKALRAAGHPATIADLAPLFERGSEKAAQLYQQAAAGFDKYEMGRLAYYDTLGWREDPKGLDSLIRAKGETLDRLLAATALGPARFGQDYTQGLHARLVAPVQQFGEFHILLHLHARDLMNKGEVDSALAVLGRAFAMTEACAEPLLVYWLVGVMAQDTCLGLIARLAPRASDAALDRAIAELSRIDPTAAMVRAFETEAVMMQAALADGYQGGVDEQGQPINFPYMNFLPIRNWVRSRQLELAWRHLELIGRPWHASHEALTALDSSVVRGGGIGNRLVRMAVPRFAAFHTRNARLVALRDAAMLGLRLVRFRREHGRLPDGRADSIGAIPQDPFTGTELRVRAGADGFVAYSAGPDGNDDGGDRKEDVAFRVKW